MNFNLKNIPERSKKPRENGLTMVMDKGLSIGECENLMSVCSDYIDIIKLGFGTSIITKNVKEKIKIYQKKARDWVKLKHSYKNVIKQLYKKYDQFNII